MSSLSAPELVRTKTGLYRITATKLDGTVQPLTGLSLWFSARFKGTYQGTAYDVLIQKHSPSNGITIVGDGSTGLADLLIDPVDSVLMPNVSPGTGTFIGPFELILINGDEHLVLDKGTMTITSNVANEA